MSSTRERNGSSVSNFGLQDFGALAAVDLATAATIKLIQPSAGEHLAAIASASEMASHASEENHAAANPTLSQASHVAFAPDTGHHAAQPEAGSSANGTSHSAETISAPSHHVVSLDQSDVFAATDRGAVSDASFASTSFQSLTAPAAFPSDAGSASAQSVSAAHEGTSSHGDFGGDSAAGIGGGNLAGFHNGAPPPVAPVGGQLWYGVDDLTNTGLDHVDSDAAGHDVADHPTDGADFANVGLDGASELYFGYTRDGDLRDGHITNDTETNQASEIQETDMVFGTGGSADEVNAIAVDPLNHIVFVGLFGQSDQYTGILEVQYNPTTGAMTNPYNATTGVVTDLNHMLFHDDNNGHVNGSAISNTNIVSMQYDMQNSTLYYVDQSNGHSFNFGSGTIWNATNGIYSVSTSGSVGGGTAPTPTLLTLNSQFAAGDNTNYIEGFAINEAQGLIYFAVNNATNSTSKLFYMPIAGGTATQMTLPGGVTLGFADDEGTGVNPVAFDPNLRQLYVSDNSDSQLVQLTLSADGHTFTSGNSDFLTIDHSVGGSGPTGLYFDPLPTLGSLSATTTEALQGGSALNLLTASPSVTDPQDGASNKLHMGFAQVVIANAQSGDNLFLSGAQSGTTDAGKITISWNSTTHTLTLTGNETETEYGTLLDQVSYQDSGTDNSSGSHPTRTVDFIISDGTTIVDQTTASSNEHAITVVIDRAPTVVADSYSPVQESGSSSGTSGTGGTGVFHNDSDLDADSFVVTAVNGSGANVGSSDAGTYGHLTLNSNGSFTYNADNTTNIDNAANGSHPVDSYTYTVSDGLGGVSSTTVSFTINRAPTVVTDSGAAVEAASGTGNVLTNDSDKDGDSLTVSQVNGSGANVGNSVAGTYGHITINANGSYTYNADNTAAIDAGVTGSHLTDSFTYQASDAHGGTTTTTITITLDRPPTVVADANTAVESGSDSGNVLTNDSDRDGDSLTVSQVNGSGANVGTSVAGTYGHITIASNGSYTYSADNTSAIDSAATGSHLTDTFSYQASDGHGGTTTSNIIITLDRAPTVVADANTALESGSDSGNVLTNDSDRDGDSLVVSAVAGSGANVGNSVATTYGHITINADGSYTYNADNTAAIDGAATGSHLTDTVSYTASDGHGGTTTTNIVITLDRAPTVVADAGAAVEAASGSGNVLTNDSDRDGDSLTVSQVNGSGANVGNSVAGTYGHVTINANGSYSYNADNTAAIDGAATGSHLTDSFTYQASDGHGGTTTTTLTITLDRAPTAINDQNSDAEGSTLTVGTASGVLANDSDRDGDSLTVSAVGGSGANVGNSFATTYGHITLNADGSYSYIADNTSAINAAATGSHPTDVINFTVSDGHGGFSNESLNIAIDRPAVANNDTNTTNESSPLTVSTANAGVLGNDTDPDGDTIVVTQVNGSAANVGTQITLASGALLTVNADGTYSYDPNHAFDYLPDFSSSGASDKSITDSFTYTIDGGATAQMVFTIQGQDSNDALTGTTGNDTLAGGIGDDVFFDDDGARGHTLSLYPDLSAGQSGGIDSFNGGSGNDVMYMGSHLVAGDQLNGSTGTDRVVLNGDYSGGVTFNSTTMTNVEILDLAAGHDYNLTMDNATVTSGNTLKVQAMGLGVGDNVTFDASADTTGGNYVVSTGAGNDTITGGIGNDKIRPGSGTDTVNGGGGNDKINMAANLDASDQIDGGAGTDAVILKGDYSGGVTFGASTMLNVETLSLTKGFSYDLVMAADTVALGETLTVRASSLQSSDSVTFDGSADTAGGNFVITTGDGNDVLTGGIGNDIFRPGAGNDIVNGGGGDDQINMANHLTAADQIDGGTGTNVLLLDGNYAGGNSLTTNSNTIVNIQQIDFAAGHDYNIIFNGLNVADGASLMFKAGNLGVSDNLTLDGSAFGAGVTLIFNDGDGHDTLIGGAGNDIFRVGTGNDTITGNGGADLIQAGSGNDTFVYSQASDSTSTGYDTIQGFDALSDRFQLLGYSVGAINTELTTGRLDAGANFDTELATAINAAHLGAHDAVLFDPNHGDLHGHTFLIVDLNGTAGYQAGQDLVIDITGAQHLTSLTTGNFIS